MNRRRFAAALVVAIVAPTMPTVTVAATEDEGCDEDDEDPITEITFESLATIGNPDAWLVYWHDRAVGQFAIWVTDVAVFHGKRPTFHVENVEQAQAYFIDFYRGRLY